MTDSSHSFFALPPPGTPFLPTLRGWDSSHERTVPVRQRLPARGKNAPLRGPVPPSPRDRMTTDTAAATEGVLELHPRGHGFLRSAKRSYAPGQEDAYVPEQL